MDGLGLNNRTYSTALTSHFLDENLATKILTANIINSTITR